MKKYITLYCGSKKGNSQTLWNEIEKFCQLLIENDFHLVYGGSQRGTMGKVAKMFLDAGKEVIGIRQNTT